MNLKTTFKITKTVFGWWFAALLLAMATGLISPPASAANAAPNITGGGVLRLNETLGDALDRNWDIPDNAPIGTAAEVMIIVDIDGYIIKSEITKSSGNDEFDKSALAAFKAVYQIVPFESWLLDAFDDGMEFGSLKLLVLKDKK